MSSTKSCPACSKEKGTASSGSKDAFKCICFKWKTRYGPPKYTNRNPSIPIFQMMTRFDDFTPDTMMNIWKRLDVDAKERMCLALHFSFKCPETPYYHWVDTELIWILRRVFIQNPSDSNDEARRLKRAFESLFTMNMENRSSDTKWFSEIGITSSIKSAIGMPGRRIGDGVDAIIAADGAHLRLIARGACKSIFGFCNGLYVFWSRSADQKRALRKYTTHILKYSDEDRCKILDLINGKRTAIGPQTYLERLLGVAGKEDFENLSFGALKTCGTCEATNREKRLLTCQKCVNDGIHPKRRYCDVQCQRKDWPKHRQFHMAHSGGSIGK